MDCALQRDPVETAEFENMLKKSYYYESTENSKQTN